jgi:hypothetical protein
MTDFGGIVQALFTLASGSAAYATTGRRVCLMQEITEFPALFVATTGLAYAPREVRGLPPKRTIAAEIWIYSDAGKDADAVPEIALFGLLSALETALAPSPVSGVQTLNGLVSHAWIEGQTEIFPGVIGGVAMAIVPVRILVP